MAASQSVDSLPSIWHIVATRAETSPDRPAYTFVDSRGAEVETLSYAGVYDQARRIGAGLAANLPPGERVLIPMTTGLEFVKAFFGCMAAGLLPVPMSPPSRHQTLGTMEAVAADCGAAAIIGDAGTTSSLQERLPESPALSALPWFDLKLVGDREPGTAGVRGEATRPGDLAFLQYTSGSTGTPKGVMVTHGNLIANQQMIRSGFGHTETSTVVGWLPLFHDQGVVGNVLQPLYVGSHCVLLSPTAFLKRPLLWLELISRYHAHTSGGPNFGYEFCIEAAERKGMPDVDLSSWRIAFNGAEPVRAATLQRFTERFQPCGFAASAHYPCYGLAEATLFVTGGDKGIVATTYAGMVGAPGGTDDTGLQSIDRAISCGRPHRGLAVRVVEPQGRTPLPPCTVGEIWISGPSVTRGYWNRPQETHAAFHATLSTDTTTTYLRTGDLGFMDDDANLYVVGRLKDIIIIRGRNLSPHDIERTAQDACPELRRDGGAAFGVELEGEERLVLVHEVSRAHQRSVDLEALAQEIRVAIAHAHAVTLADVALVKPGSIPKTTSGKTKRSEARRIYEQDRFASRRIASHTPPDGENAHV